MSTPPFFYKASRVPRQLRVPQEVPTPVAHHKMWPLRGELVGDTRYSCCDQSNYSEYKKGNIQLYEKITKAEHIICKERC